MKRTRPGRPRKGEVSKLRIRADKEQQARWEKAAEMDHRSFQSWAEGVLDREADKVLARSIRRR